MKKASITNKSLVVLLIGAMIISLGGTFISLSRLGRIGSPYITGNAESGTGQVAITIASTLSIVITDDGVDYGSCRPMNTSGKFFDSDGDNMYTVTGEEGKCTGNELKPNGPGDFLTVANDGNIDANVTVMTDDNAVVVATNTSLWFRTMNNSQDPGCYGDHQSWTNFTSTGTDYPACDNLSTAANFDAFDTAFRIWIPSSTLAGSDDAIITYTAHVIS